MVLTPFSLSFLSSFYRDILNEEISSQVCLCLWRGAESWGKKREQQSQLGKEKKTSGS